MLKMKHIGELTTLLDVVEAQARQCPAQVAVICGDRQIAVAELSALGHRIARTLRVAGIGKGDRVCYLAKNEWEFIPLSLACVEIGIALVPVNWRLADGEIMHILAHSKSRMAFVGEEFAERLRKLQESLPELGQVVSIGTGPESLERWASPQSDLPIGDRIEPSAVCFQMYTSGTTGLPKGAMITNRNLAAAVPVTARSWGIKNGSVPMVSSPLFHIAGIAYALAGIWNGGTLVIVKDATPENLLRAIEERCVTSSLMVPAMILMMLNHPDSRNTDLSSLERIAYGASPISEDVLRRAIGLFGCEFVQSYGMTETTGGVVELPPADHLPDAPTGRLRAAGVPLEGVEIKVVDEEGHDLPEGGVGEVLIRSDQNMLGYWADEASTRDVLSDEGWFRTGDAGYVDRGYLHIHDRIKDMIISGGENVYSTEVENVLMSHPDIANCAVIGVPDVKWGETVKAFVVLSPEAFADEVSIINYCADRLAKFKCPTSVEFLKELPFNAAGKMLKRKLRADFWPLRDRQVN
ncbi:long-chain-fatty-acid--CoA ligase [Rhodococcus sp. ABRD24]|uniref:long-chain-fatty-acid--CoA ligase n=1 Tax=Rhodococcus sp. ABRD24 TaxID=2507582 RepID=UPI001038E93D|nr:long-chain-fatty-acid--CoA ligase [Rhodococcus sp. ABRD24]QBJ97318.1 long-chain-fatty-acid--CoA ligase [Rhodococcus sp. ABRD24]